MDKSEAIDQFLRNSLVDLDIEPRITSFDQVMRKLEKRKRRRFLFFLLPGIVILGSFLTIHLNEGTVNETSLAKAPVKIPDNSISRPSAEVDAGRTNELTTTSRQISQTDKINKKYQATKRVSSGIAEIAGADPKTEDKNEMPLQAIQAVEKQALDNNYEKTEYTWLPSFQMYLNVDTNRKEMHDVADPTPATELVPTRKKIKKQFLIGLHFSPQISYLQLKENENRNDRYDTDGGAFAGEYLQTRKDQNKGHLTYSFGLKFGLQLNDRWEFLAGLGMQKWRYSESLAAPIPVGNYNTFSPTSSNLNYQLPLSALGSSTFMNVFKYYSLSLEAGRIWQLRAFTFKAGGGLAIHYNYAMSGIIVYNASGYQHGSRYDYASTFDRTKTLITPFLKAGLMEDLGSRLTFQLSPFIYYNPASAFSKDYIIKQKFYGAGVEALFIIKL